MNNIKHRLTLTCATLGLACFTLLANAQEQPSTRCKDQPNPQECRKNRTEKFHASREVRWHDELKITPAQEPAWKNFLESMHKQNALHKEFFKKSADAEMENLSAPDRLEKVLTKMEKRQTAMRAHLTALKALYTTLTPEQQAILNKHLNDLAHHRSQIHDKQQMKRN